MSNPMRQLPHSSLGFATSALAAGFGRGLAQAMSGGGSHRAFPPIRSAAEAFREDWIKLGGDMHRAVEKAAPRGG